MNIKQKIEEFKKIFNPLFEQEIKKILKEQADFNPVVTQLDGPLTDFALNYTRGGKRIRPFLINFCANENTNTAENLKNL